MEFSLSEEQKRRIEQEEAARVAEENYREHVRQSMRSLSPPTKSEMPTRSERRGIGSRGFWITLTFVVLIGGAWIHSADRPSPNGPEAPPVMNDVPRWVPVKVQLIQGQFQVPAQNSNSWPFVVPDRVRNYRLRGHFSAIGGTGNDIEAVVATEDEFQNWINGHQAQVFYSTPGRVTTGSIDVVLPPGRYVFGFNNRFSLLTSKAVLLEIYATYEQRQ